MTDEQKELEPVESAPAADPESKVYIGASSVVGKDELAGGNIKVSLSDGSVEYLTPEQFEDVKSNEPYKDGEISLRKWKKTIASILDILLKSNMQMADKDWIMNRIDESIMESFKNAVSKKFGVNLMNNISLQQVDEVLKSK